MYKIFINLFIFIKLINFVLISSGKTKFSMASCNCICGDKVDFSLQQVQEGEGGLPTRPEEPEESAAEKIYASLRECREQADPKKQKGVKMQGYLFKKKERRWKQQYFVLKQDGADSHLYFYDSPKRTKPKGLIDLSCAYMYTVHESFFDKRFCFQVK